MRTKTIFSRPTEDFKLQSGNSKPFFLRVSNSLTTRNDIEISFDDLTPDANGWCTVEKAFKSTINASKIRMFTYAAREHGVDIKSITITEEGTNTVVLNFTVDGIVDAFNAHTAYHFTQMTPVQDKVGDGTYIYFFGQGSYRKDDIYMARVRKSEFENFKAYEYFAGRNADGSSIWTKNAAEAKMLIDLVDGASNISIAYNKGLGQWMLTYCGMDEGNSVRFASSIDGEYTAPYTIIEKKDLNSFVTTKPLKGYPFTNYTKRAYQAYGLYVNSQWISDDGLSFYCIMSQYNDCYNVSLVKVTLAVKFAE